MRTRSATEWKTDLDFQSLVGIYLLSLVSGIGVLLVCFLGQDTQVTYTLVALLLSIRQRLTLDDVSFGGLLSLKDAARVLQLLGLQFIQSGSIGSKTLIDRVDLAVSLYNLATDQLRGTFLKDRPSVSRSTVS